MPAPILTREQLRQVFDRVLKGEKISHISEELGVEATGLTHRLRRQYPDEYARASDSGLISTGWSSRASKERAEKTETDPAVQAYLQGKGTYKDIAAQYDIPWTTLYNRVQRVLKLQKERAESPLT